jgi:hypothetical protein
MEKKTAFTVEVTPEYEKGYLLHSIFRYPWFQNRKTLRNVFRKTSLELRIQWAQGG